ncbi:MAG: hypothetical protein KME52_20655 [Desmonostoc geniculatum HA4340-LM1]|nr:hypothetical protein [Desmonostoc geniculatum HA4340-LM1]
MQHLVNNAGIAVPGPLELLAIAEFQHQMNVNVTGQLAVWTRCENSSCAEAYFTRSPP